MSGKTHPEITNPLYRRMLAREMRIIRKAAREQNGDVNAAWAFWYIVGFETAMRRLCNAQLVEDIKREVVS